MRLVRTNRAILVRRGASRGNEIATCPYEDYATWIEGACVFKGLLVVLTLAAMSTLAAAQSHSAGQSSTTAEDHSPENCPINFTAVLSGRAMMHSTSDQNGSSEQLLQVGFTSLPSSIAGATIIVHGVYPRGRLLPTVQRQSDEALKRSLYAISPENRLPGIFGLRNWPLQVGLRSRKFATQMEASGMQRQVHNVGSR